MKKAEFTIPQIPKRETTGSLMRERATCFILASGIRNVHCEAGSLFREPVRGLVRFILPAESTRHLRDGTPSPAAIWLLGPAWEPPASARAFPSRAATPVPASVREAETSQERGLSEPVRGAVPEEGKADRPAGDTAGLPESAEHAPPTALNSPVSRLPWKRPGHCRWRHSKNRWNGLPDGRSRRQAPLRSSSRREVPPTSSGTAFYRERLAMPLPIRLRQ